MKIVTHAKNLTLLGRTTIFYKKMVALITEELPTFSTLSVSQQQSMLNSLGLAIIHLPTELAADTIEILLACDPNYLTIVRKTIIEGKSDCEKVRIINSYLLVQNPNRIITLLRIEWPSAQRNQRESIASAIATFIKYHPYFRSQPSSLWNTILETITETRTASGGSTIANKHLKDAEEIINQHLEKDE